jgi:hypothetical protein
MKIKSRKIPEYVIYLFLWLLFLIIPIITNNYSSKGDFAKIFYDGLRLVPFIIIFLVNNILLLPFLLFRSRTKLYVVSLFIVALSVTSVFHILNPLIFKADPKVLEQRVLKDPQWGREEMRPGIPPAARNNISSSPELFKAPAESGISQNRRMPLPGQPFVQFINTFLISLLIAGFNTAIAVTNRWFDEEQARKEIEKEHMKSELAFLQNQISPHFFMNTLNNIHALIEADQKLAQNAVLKLSEMMRYLLYESGRGTTTLKREIDFLISYVRLMQLRVDDSVKVNFEFPEDFSNVNLPPLLFISFIENAFKHGVSYREPSELSFKLIQEKDALIFISENSISSFRSTDMIRHHGGIGLENIKKRLELLYKGNHQLLIENNQSTFKVTLIIQT